MLLNFKKEDNMTKFPNLTRSILNELLLPEECSKPTTDKGEYIIYVVEDGREAARILVNESNHDIKISFNYDIDPAWAAHIILVLSAFDNIKVDESHRAYLEIYESYRFDKNGEILWRRGEKNEWVMCEEKFKEKYPLQYAIHKEVNNG